MPLYMLYIPKSVKFSASSPDEYTKWLRGLDFLIKETAAAAHPIIVERYVEGNEEPFIHSRIHIICVSIHVWLFHRRLSCTPLMAPHHRSNETF